MALPFLKNKKESGIASTIIKNRAPDEPSESESEPEEYSLEDCAMDIMDAIHTKDVTALASALKEAFQKLDSEPHEEGEHTNPSPHTFEAQNIKAGQE